MKQTLGFLLVYACYLVPSIVSLTLNYVYFSKLFKRACREDDFEKIDDISTKMWLWYFLCIVPVFNFYWALKLKNRVTCDGE